MISACLCSDSTTTARGSITASGGATTATSSCSSWASRCTTPRSPPSASSSSCDTRTSCRNSRPSPRASPLLCFTLYSAASRVVPARSFIYWYIVRVLVVRREYSPALHFLCLLTLRFQHLRTSVYVRVSGVLFKVFYAEQILYTWTKCTRMSVRELFTLILSTTRVHSHTYNNTRTSCDPPRSVCSLLTRTRSEARRGEASERTQQYIGTVLVYSTSILSVCVLARLVCIAFHSWGLWLLLERSLRVGCVVRAIVSKSYHLPAPTSVLMSLNWLYLRSLDRPIPISIYSCCCPGFLNLPFKVSNYGFDYYGFWR